MAGERKGKAYEAVVVAALEDLQSEGLFDGSMYWDVTPDGMTIKADIMIGADKNNPRYLFLITYSGSAKNSPMKFWRNLGELVEAKTCLAKTPRVICLTFGSIFEDSEPIQTWSFDEFRWERGK